MKDGIFASMGPPPFYGVISFYARSSQIVSEFIAGLLINGPEVLEHAEVQRSRRAYTGSNIL
jgi:hypothetical protein